MGALHHSTTKLVTFLCLQIAHYDEALLVTSISVTCVYTYNYNVAKGEHVHVNTKIGTWRKALAYTSHHTV